MVISRAARIGQRCGSDAIPPTRRSGGSPPVFEVRGRNATCALNLAPAAQQPEWRWFCRIAPSRRENAGAASAPCPSAPVRPVRLSQHQRRRGGFQQWPLGRDCGRAAGSGASTVMGRWAASPPSIRPARGRGRAAEPGRASATVAWGRSGNAVGALYVTRIGKLPVPARPRLDFDNARAG